MKHLTAIQYCFANTLLIYFETKTFLTTVAYCQHCEIMNERNIVTGTPPEACYIKFLNGYNKDLMSLLTSPNRTLVSISFLCSCKQ